MQQVTTPFLTLDFRKGRIRIYRATLKLLNSPDYIRLLVNPEQEIIAVQVSDVNEARALRSSGIRVDSQKNYDLSSRALTDQLRPCWKWEAGKSYRLTGRYIKEMNIVAFDFDTSVCVSPVEGPESIISEHYGAQNEISLPTHH